MDFLISSGITLSHFLALAAILFAIGVCGIVINSRSVINVLLSLELMLLSVNLNFAAFSSYSGDMQGQIFVVFVLTVAAAESAIGLAIMLAHFRNAGNIDLGKDNLLKM
ncbi:NADH-quinone oxidoreductase subunit NuoK [Anaplasma phagocytophilum]|uniref:NADH-quinone oxidoreductase subunit K n=6 Tax=Anaplasma phagocytophilum TaxID=948 RepID=A0A098EGL5_ANAPH|nr:NADH-quinone oxidoreductase subunit NuoK [Anaplasma phagocytophilum]ABD44329.1 NADH dehydrogenase I, K subunit [Anaplasma phagocytophilum str. HZ]AGR78794.1 NADH-quinone oxidoreductase [Anaplasma phagocytophilum str. HZ2]AGR80041.1 NADH-quinone oxidoreductase [Anaplasma phagocytophilum str. JM]AGR81296.1 NADH-quinone oxidoreductase [Anaplasma phagocytophilum str. Dog2]ANC34148.1 NADH-quinone oxidoreductase subunit K [Anaplasma phagocytophilum str. Norway variant2]